MANDTVPWSDWASAVESLRNQERWSVSTGTPRRDPGPSRRQATVLESVEEIRTQARGAASPRTVQESVPPAQDDLKSREETPLYRPLVRPPMGLLHVFDDGESTGEVVRIRSGSFVIGRVEGDLVIPHDSGMSGRHAEIVRRSDGNGIWTWHLRDLGSTNGTFVRAATILLEPGQEFMVGTRLFRFELTVPAIADLESRTDTTRKWEVPARAGAGGHAVGTSAPAALVEISKGAVVRRHALADRVSWLGRDPSSCQMLVDDPYVDLHHARVARDEKGRWVVANERSRNGLWGRIGEVGLERGGFFQCGEQRFLFKAL